MPRALRFKRLVLCSLLLAVFVPIFLQAQTRIAVISDTHIGAGNADRDLQAVIEAINARRDIDFVAHAGDITEKGRDAEFRLAKNILDRLNVPYFVVPGNHDSHWIGRGLAGFETAWPSDHFFFGKNGSYFIGLNTWEFGHIDPETLSWFKAAVSNLPQSAQLFVFVHDPPDAIDNWASIHNLLRNRRAVVVAGHVHRTGVDRTEGRIPVITARASISRGDTQPCGFVIIDIAGESIATREINGRSDPISFETLRMENRPPLDERPERAFKNFAAEILWRKNLESVVLAPPLVSRNAAYVLTRSGSLTSFDLRGQIMWRRDFEEPVVSRPALWRNNLYVGTASGKIFKIDRRSGRLLAATNIGERPTAQLAVIAAKSQILLLAGTGLGKLFALDAETMRNIWANSSAAEMIQTRPLGVSGRIVFGSWAARLHGLDAETGRELWSWTENDNFYYAPAGCVPASDGIRAFVCSPDGFVSAVDLASGKTVWREKASSWESLALSADKKKVLVKNRTDEFRVLDAATGTSLRVVSPAQGPGDLFPCEPLDTGKEILYGGQNGTAYKIDANGTLSVLFESEPGGIHSIQSAGRGVFVAADLDGRIVAFRLKQ